MHTRSYRRTWWRVQPLSIIDEAVFYAFAGLRIGNALVKQP